jgi:hypothetical protein
MLLYLSSTRGIPIDVPDPDRPQLLDYTPSENTVEVLFHFASAVVTVLNSYSKKILEAFLDTRNGKLDFVQRGKTKKCCEFET